MKIARLTGWFVTILILGAVGALLYGAAQLYPSNARPPRSMMLTSAPHIALVATLPQTPEFSGYDSKGEPIQLDLGFSYREISALWMPFFASKDQGLILYSATGGTITIAPVTDIDRAAIVTATGTDLVEAHSFPFYEHFWGWLFVLAFILAAWLMAKRVEWKRDKEGIM